MNKETNVTTSNWFDQWVKQADARRARKRHVTDLIMLIANIMCITGLLIMLIGVMWIDATDICAQNVMMSFVGVALIAIGAHVRYEIEGGFLW